MPRSVSAIEFRPRVAVGVGLASALALLNGAATPVSAENATRLVLPRVVAPVERAAFLAPPVLRSDKASSPRLIAALARGKAPRPSPANERRRIEPLPVLIADAAPVRASLSIPLVNVAPGLGQPAASDSRVVDSTAPAALGPAQIEQIPGALTVRDFASIPAGSRAAGGADLPAQIAAMQVPLPAGLGAGSEERTALLATAPEQLTVRVDGLVLGKVAVHSDSAGGFNVQLSGLLDVLGDRFPPDEFQRLRQSTGAEAYVAFARLKDAGIDVHYDPAYDELTLGS